MASLFELQLILYCSGLLFSLSYLDVIWWSRRDLHTEVQMYLQWNILVASVNQKRTL